ncbi:DNA translocase FtsK [Niallia sp. XMNu-256]|uniref:DNA translocase FtsK n=1 Tax=Niallia sp. XMNu-256 TaxID=3082444 RepID=UPI0030D2AF05
MNWMKKLFSFFKEEDSKSITDSIEPNEQLHPLIQKQRLENGKKVNAKVAYQYPKGQFRFPLVPDRDENKSKPKAVPTNNHLNRRQERKTATLPRQRELKNRRIAEKEDRYTNQREEQTTETRMFSSEIKQEPTRKHQEPANDPRRNRPFQPTIIPSPVYGFKERPIKAENHYEEVELELQANPAQNVVQKENSPAYQGQKPDEEIEMIETLPLAKDGTKFEKEGRHSTSESSGAVDPIMNESVEVAIPVKNVIQQENSPAYQGQKPDEEIEIIETLPLAEDGTKFEKESRHSTSESSDDVDPIMNESVEVAIPVKNVIQQENSPAYQGQKPDEEIEIIETLPLAEDGTKLKKESRHSTSESSDDVDLIMNESVEVALPVEKMIQKESSHAYQGQESGEGIELIGTLPLAEEGTKFEKESRQSTSESSDAVDLIMNESIEVAVTAEEERVEESQANCETDQTKNSEHQNESSDIHLESEPVEATERPKERSSIPFNVIMLKQDKQKLSQKHHAKNSKKNSVQIPSFTQKQESQGGEALQPEGEFVLISDEQNTVQRELEVPQEQQLDFKDPEETEQEETSYRVNIERLDSLQIEEPQYSFPSMMLLNPPILVEGNNDWIDEQSELLNRTLKNFNVGAKVVNVTQGPAVTRFEVQPEPGVKVNKITNLSDDIKLSLAARDIRIEAPIPGKHTIGIEVPNENSRAVNISEIISEPEFYEQESPLTAVLGLDISGKPIVTDLRKMPHGLIAGATGSGKSVCINTILVSLLYKATPDQLKLLLIDPKMVELAPYNHIPHLVSPVITDVKAATAALKWAVEEMERRYELFAHTGVRDITRFNELAQMHKQYSDKLPYIVIVIDELADLMMMSPADVEEAISRIAQKARACGIHLIIATQRPSVDVITGLIKSNIPTRIAFSVSSQIDSRTIIDISGAEKLLGKGDMLFLENGAPKPVRIQGTFVSDSEIDQVVSHVRDQGEPNYLFQQEELLKKTQVEEEDELFYEACEFVVEHGGASTSLLQRRFKIGYNRAARLIDMMEFHGYISESKGSKPREVYLTDTDLETLH